MQPPLLSARKRCMIVGMGVAIESRDLAKGFMAAFAVWLILATAQAALVLGFGAGTAPPLGIVTLYGAQAVVWTLVTLATARLAGALGNGRP